MHTHPDLVVMWLFYHLLDQRENPQLLGYIHLHPEYLSYTRIASFQLQLWDLIYIPFLSGLRFLRAMQFIRLADILQYLGIIHSRYGIFWTIQYSRLSLHISLVTH